MRISILVGILMLTLISCTEKADQNTEENIEITEEQKLLNKYVTVRLTSDMGALSDNEKQIVAKLIQAGSIMDELFWFDAYGDKEELLNSIEDEDLKKFAMINYGPWDRLNNNEPFIEGVGAKPAGANYYPADMTREEFEAAELEGKSSLYTYLRRDDDGNLVVVPYHEMFTEEVGRVAEILRECAELAEDPGLKRYLELRATALETDEYQESDMAWMDMKSNRIEVVIGPIETYEDQLYGQKAAHETFVLIKDMDWSERLARYADFLPELQTGLPVEEEYRAEMPGTDADLNAYDVVYYAGDCNAGSKTIAINLPNDEEVQLAKGTRRLQLKNAMRAKFDQILIPIANNLIAAEQRKYITFNAFFSNTMFHEVAHGLGIKNTLDGSGTVRQALREHASALEEGKADILGLYMITQLHEKGELEGNLEDYYVTFMTSIFRSVRFGASSAHGKANMIRFNFFKEMGAFSKDEDGLYSVNFEIMKEAMNALSSLILHIQGDGDYEEVASLVASRGVIGPELQEDLDKLADAGIPVDIIFEQGIDVLGLE